MTIARGIGAQSLFLPPWLVEADPETRRRAQVVGGLSVVVALLVGIVGIGHWMRGAYAAAVLAWGLALVALGVFMLLRVTRSLDLVANLLIGVIVCAMTGGALLRGGLGTPPTMALAAIPGLSFVIVSRRYAFGWASVIAVVLISFLVLERTGFLIGDLVPTPSRAITSFLTSAVFLVVVLAFAYGFEQRKRAALMALQTREQQLFEAEAARLRAESEAQLFRQDRLASIGQLAAGTAHEINNPLAYIVANLQTVQHRLEHGAFDAEDVRGALRDALVGAQQIERIVKDLKAYARADDEKIGPVDVNEVVETAVKMAGSEARHRAQVRVDLATVPRVDADMTRLCQVVLNLILNSAQAIGEGDPDNHSIVISTHLVGDRVEIEVCDDGPGIPPELLSKVTDPFFTTKPVGSGTGLGLFVTASLVRRFRGELLIESEPGKGTRVRVRLPPSEQPPAEVDKPAVAARVARRAKVLVIDDEPMVAKAIARTLRGHDVTIAERGELALQSIEKDAEFDLVLCDVTMPGINGFELYERLVREHPALSARFVLMSGGALSQQHADLRQAFPGVVLDKPFSREKILELIESFAG